MKTQAFFKNIKEEIIKEISVAEVSIKVAVAWLTDEELFDLLYQKAQKGIIVELIVMDDKINQNSGIDYSLLNDAKGKVWKIKQFGNRQPLMHNKFCIIDRKTIINGSYNWTKKAQINKESITVVKENIDFASDFEQEFENLKEKYFGDDLKPVKIDYDLICIRLETLKNVILLEDREDIENQIFKLRNQLPPNSTNDNVKILYEILDFTIKQNYGKSVSLINTFSSKFRTLTIFIDPEIAALKLEIKALEIQISSLEDERAEMEKKIFTFEVLHDKILGPIILQILKLRKERLLKEKEIYSEKEVEFIDAEQDYKSYKESYETALKEDIIELAPVEQKELNSTFKKASKLCHPDVVADEQKGKAQKVFIELKKAYEKNDLERVKDIFNDLKKGVFVAIGENVNAKQKLLSIVIELRSKRNEYENILRQLIESETFQSIQQITDRDEYFEEKKMELSKVLEKEKSLSDYE